MMRGVDATARGDRRRCGVLGGSVGAQEVDFSPSGDSGRCLERLTGLAKSLCQVEAVIDSQGRPVVDSEGRP